MLAVYFIRKLLLRESLCFHYPERENSVKTEEGAQENNWNS